MICLREVEKNVYKHSSCSMFVMVDNQSLGCLFNHSEILVSTFYNYMTFYFIICIGMLNRPMHSYTYNKI